LNTVEILFLFFKLLRDGSYHPTIYFYQGVFAVAEPKQKTQTQTEKQTKANKKSDRQSSA